MKEIFVVDVHKDQLIYVDDPQPIIPLKKSNQRGRKTSRYQAQTQPVRVDHRKEALPEAAWQRYKLRDGTKGKLIVEIVHRRVWLWDKNEAVMKNIYLAIENAFKNGLCFRRLKDSYQLYFDYVSRLNAKFNLTAVYTDLKFPKNSSGHHA